MGRKTMLRQWIALGRFRVKIAKLLYDLVIVLELEVEQALDLLYPGGGTHHQTRVEHRLTAIVKTFERPRILRRLLKSILRKYPSLPIIIADDSRDPENIPGVQSIVMPYDSGVSAGRHEALRHVKTEYVLVLDDDFVFYRHTSLEAALAIMDNHPRIDVMGGEVIDLPFFERADYSREGLFPTDAKATMPGGSTIGGLPVYDKVANFFIARTDRIRLVGWDPRLKRMEHTDFFTRARGILTTVFNEEMKCLHAKTPFDMAYMQKREDLGGDWLILQQRYFRNDSRPLGECHMPGPEQ
jgi:glycosyltransferase involved in cell wall biosynthesis